MQGMLVVFKYIVENNNWNNNNWVTKLYNFVFILYVVWFLFLDLRYCLKKKRFSLLPFWITYKTCFIFVIENMPEHYYYMAHFVFQINGSLKIHTIWRLIGEIYCQQGKLGQSSLKITAASLSDPCKESTSLI